MQQESPTIPDALWATAGRGAGEYVFHLDDGVMRLTCAELAERARRGARRLVSRGIEPGDAVGVLGPNRPEWLVWAFASWMAGAAVVPVQIPLRIRSPEAFADQLRSLVRAAGCRLVLADPRLASLLSDEVAMPWEERGEESREEPAGPDAADTAVIQFTSGSTARPKGVVVTHAAVLAQLALINMNYHEASRVEVGWVPFFHDLGLITTAIFPAYGNDSTVELLPTERFARDPAEWLRLIERTRALGTLAPSSAFGSAIRAAERSGERIDIGSLIVAHFAAEGVDPAVARKMGEVATRKFGLRPDALGSTYGLAEAVLGVSYPEVGSGMRLDRVSLEGLGEDAAVPAGEEPSRLIVSSGRPVMDVRIAAPDLSELPERQVGEILVRGSSLASGYLGDDAPDPFVGDWLRTGDLGYLADGELYVAGRAKDMMIAMGQNHYPEDFEWAAARVPGVRPGRCVAFNLPDSEDVAVLVEAQEGFDSNGFADEIADGVADVIGVRPSEVMILPPGAVEKTTSGKLRRAAMREAYAKGELARLTASGSG